MNGILTVPVMKSVSKRRTSYTKRETEASVCGSALEVLIFTLLVFLMALFSSYFLIGLIYSFIHVLIAAIHV